MTLTILGAPRTKKNHGRRIKRGRRIFHVPSEAHDAWATSAILQLRVQHRTWDHRNGTPLYQRVNLRALVYRERRTGDLGNYLAAVCDALERAGVVANDKFIEGFDGSRLLVDKANPRVEIELMPL